SGSSSNQLFFYYDPAHPTTHRGQIPEPSFRGSRSTYAVHHLFYEIGRRRPGDRTTFLPIGSPESNPLSRLVLLAWRSVRRCATYPNRIGKHEPLIYHILQRSRTREDLDGTGDEIG